jgi:hypothetical protein
MRAPSGGPVEASGDPAIELRNGRRQRARVVAGWPLADLFHGAHRLRRALRDIQLGNDAVP